MNWTRWLGLEEYNAWEIQWVSPVPAWGLAALLGLAAVILWFFWTGLGRLRSPGKKALLVLLRAAVLGLLGCILMQPRLELKNIQPLRNIIAVLLDDSKSLGIKTFPGEVTRMEVVRRSLQNNREFLDALKERYQVDYFFVSDALDPVAASELETRYRPRGINTDFTQVFAELQTRYAGKSLQGVMLFSDGADLTQVEGALSPELSDLLVQLDGPVHALQAGGNAGFLDLGIETLEVSDFGFVYQPLRLSATVTAVGLGARRVSLVLREGGKIHTSRVVELKPGQERYEVELEFTPGVTGKRLFTLELPVFAGEAVEVNNKVHFQVNVVRDRIRVLHLNGRPSWDSRFLREMLINNPKVDLLSFFILRTLTDDVMATTSELSLIPFPSNLLFSDYLNSFDLVVFQNFKFKPFIDKRYLANIKKFVQAGGGFMMIGGDLSFQGGGYLRTPVEEILPVRLQRNSPWLLLEEVRPRIPPAAARHPILALEKDEALNREVWKTLPPLNGLNLGLQPAAGAQTLAGYQTRDGGELPVLVTAQVGEGRSLVLATDTSWNWNFMKVGEGGSGRYYQRFWENVISWMTSDPATDPLQIETNRERYQEGDGVLISYTARGPDYNPLAKAPVTVTVHSIPGGRELLRREMVAGADGTGSLEFIPPGEGFFSARLQLTDANAARSQETRFSVFSPTLEYQKPWVNPEFLKSLAQVTGGEYLDLTATPPLNELTFPNPEYEIKTSCRTTSLWDNWWSYGLILSLLFVEWWMRRRAGLS